MQTVSLLEYSGIAIDHDVMPIEHKASMSLIKNISTKTGQDISAIRNMTHLALAPWVIDDFERNDFVTYVNQFSVLVKKGVDGYLASENWFPWGLNKPLARACLKCVEENDGMIKLSWSYPFILTCGKHPIMLRTAKVYNGKFGSFCDNDEYSAPDSVIAMDRKSYQALNTGEVSLFTRKINCGLWFRMLRRIIHEISIPPHRCGQKQGKVLKEVWRYSGYRKEHILSKWKAFEDLSCSKQQILLTTASHAIALLEKELIVPYGKWGYLFSPQEFDPAHSGKKEYNPLRDAVIEMKRLLELAKEDRQIAIDLFLLVLLGRRDTKSISTIKEIFYKSDIPNEYFSQIDRLLVF
jgi:hypothetical protein